MRFRYNNAVPCRCDGIGRRSGLKIHRWRQRTGSSPVTGTSSSQATYRLRRAFSFHCKAHRALSLLLLASKSQPLTLGCDLVLGANLKVAASILLRYSSSSQATYCLQRAFSFHCKAHRALMPLLLLFKSQPLTLGFDLVLVHTWELRHPYYFPFYGRAKSTLLLRFCTYAKNTSFVRILS